MSEVDFDEVRESVRAVFRLMEEDIRQEKRGEGETRWKRRRLGGK